MVSATPGVNMLPIAQGPGPQTSRMITDRSFLHKRVVSSNADRKLRLGPDQQLLLEPQTSFSRKTNVLLARLLAWERQLPRSMLMYFFCSECFLVSLKKE